MNTTHTGAERFLGYETDASTAKNDRWRHFWDSLVRVAVAVGGVSTDELSSKTFESKAVPGLYFIGETVDVTGHLGGFNFQWAWASGWCAGQYV